MTSSDHRWILILAAGEGSRLRSLTLGADGVPVPKQFCSLLGGRSLLGETIERARRVAPPERIVVVVAAEHRRWWQPQLTALPPHNVVIQPRNRGTAPGILLPLLAVLERDPEARVLVLPSDHHVAREAVLARAARRALELVERSPEVLALLGIAAEGADGEYGWIVPGPPAEEGAFRVHSFVEKPGAERSAVLLAEGGVWNSFLFASRGATLRARIAASFPALVDGMEAACREDLLAGFYDALETIDFSRSVLEGAERSLRLVRVPACGWSDLGTPRRVAGCLAQGAVRRCRDLARSLAPGAGVDLRARLAGLAREGMAEALQPALD